MLATHFAYLHELIVASKLAPTGNRMPRFPSPRTRGEGTTPDTAATYSVRRIVLILSASICSAVNGKRCQRFAEYSFV